MGFTVLLLLLLGTAGWWLHSRWAALRDAQQARREAELLMVFEARSQAASKPAEATPAPSDFYPTLPAGEVPAAQRAAAGAKPPQRPRTH